MLELITLPVDLMSGYWLEKRFGLSRQSLGGFMKDWLKMMVVSLVLGAAAVEAIYAFIGLMGPNWYWGAGAVFVVFFIILAQLAPVVLLPWFYTFTPVTDEGLKKRLDSLCRRSGAEVQGFYEWGLSAKSSRANAALLGLGRTRRVVLSDSLLEHFTPSEIEVVVAHELGHHKGGHILWLIGLQSLIALAVFFLADRLFRLAGPWFDLERLSDPAGLPLLLLCFLIAGALALPVANTVSRHLERRADRFAWRITGLTGSFVSAMERLAALNLSEMRPPALIEHLFAGHPAPARRIRAAINHRRESRGLD
jgi:STE24 endopeptidase